MSTKYPQGLITGTPPYAQGDFSGVWTLEQLAKNYYFYGDGIANSLRFRSSASAYLNRTFGTPTNTYKFTFSFWMKRGVLSAQENFLGSNTYPNYMTVSINAADQLAFVYGGTNAYGGYTTAVFRDPSAWYHIVYAVDTTQATDSNRVKIYVNGVQQTAITTIPGVTATYPPQNTANPINSSGMVNEIAATNYTGTNTQFFDGYMAEINFIDGQALDPSYFGVTATATGVWSPKKYTGTYGTNGFRLNFSNGTSTTTLGYDSSGNSNNWTTNNISLTAGSTYDWMLDSPTSFAGSSYGVGNYAVLNPLDKSSSITASDGNLAITCAAVSHNLIRSTIALPSSGKFYAEMTFGSTMTGNPAAAFALLAANASVTSHPVSAGNYCVYGSANTGLYSGANTGATITGMTTGQVWQFAVDVDGGNAWIGLNNSWFNVYTSGSNTGNPSTGANPTFTGSFAGMFFGADLVNTSAIINLGQRPFAYTPPSGYKSLCTQNLTIPTVPNGARYFAATLYTGTNATQSVSNAVNNVIFQPDLVWVKSRSAATDHKLTDSVRGVTKALISDTTGAETTDTNGLTAFGSSGFTLGTDTVYNNTSATYVGWQWKAGGTAVTNTAGSITSSVSANTTAGFSVVTYTGNGTTGTYGHGLGIAPSMVIAKRRDTGSSNWVVYAVGAWSAGNYLILNATDAVSSVNAVNTFGNNSVQVQPSSTVVTIGSGTNMNASGGTYVAYCFAAIAGYSAFGSYIGNGSDNGPFVYCGFRPRFVMTKRTDSTSDWIMLDTSRDTYNVSGLCLEANLSNAESTNGGSFSSQTDILSNGFKIRNSGGGANASGGTYVYACFAENPFNYSLAR